MNPEDFDRIVQNSVPVAAAIGAKTVRCTAQETVIRLGEPGPELLRPGGTVSGPVLFTLGDIAFFGLVLAAIGPAELAVTTDATIHFLNKPEPVPILAVATPLKRGRRLFIAECTFLRESDHLKLAHMVGTYSIPPEPG